MNDALTVSLGLMLLLVVSVVAIVCRRLELPYSVGLVTAGIFSHSRRVTPRSFSRRTASTRSCCRR